MKPDKYDKNIDELIGRAIGRQRPTLDFDKWQQDHQKEIHIYKAQPKKPSDSVESSEIWRTIMKSPITKLAAAVIIIAVLASLPFLGGKDSGIALGDVLININKTNAYMYTMEMKITGKLMPTAQESKIQAVVSDDYGMKWYVDMIDPNTGKTTTQVIYVVPEQKMVISLIPETKQYIRWPFGDAILDRMKQQNNDPREIIKQIMKCKYDELDRAVIDGVEVQGFRTTDPEFLVAIGSDATNIELTLWVDVKNWLPFRSEIDIKSGEQEQITGATYDYRWNVPVNASDFEPVIPDDFKPFSRYGVKLPGMNEAAAIEGLRLFAEITGKYPKKMNMLELAEEIAALKDYQYLKDQLRKLKDQMSDQMTDDELRNALMKKSIEIMQPLQSIGFFYMTLVTDKKEPVYYGEFVGPDDADKVLLKWKESDNHYRVIFGDLTAEDLTDEQWNEFEK
jgi:hypothetical protein